MCGEKLQQLHVLRFREGSPPRVRGKDINAKNSFRLSRITPACAGKSYSRLGTLPGVEDHPRVCGEKKTGAPPLLKPKGSPPRVRGKVLNEDLSNIVDRITPACAGKRLRNLRKYAVSK